MEPLEQLVALKALELRLGLERELNGFNVNQLNDHLAEIAAIVYGPFVIEPAKEPEVQLGAADLGPATPADAAPAAPSAETPPASDAWTPPASPAEPTTTA